MSYLTERQPLINGRISALYALSGRIGLLAWTLGLILAISLAFAVLITWAAPPAGAQTTDMSTWPDHFDGINHMGPYAWVDGPTAPKTSGGDIINGVVGGVVGEVEVPFRLFLCRAQLQDGMHPGKYFDGHCNIGWGGKEVVLTQGYQVLVNTQPQDAQYFTQLWHSSTSASSADFHGGSVGDTWMRVCRATYNKALHPGKEWNGRCNIGWGGQEVALDTYDVLALHNDRAMTLITTTSTVSLSLLWSPDNIGVGFANLAQYLPSMIYFVIDKYNAAQTDPALRRDRTVMFNGLKAGDAWTQGALIPVMVELAKSIVDRDPSTWTSNEKNYVLFLQALAQDQRQRAAALAQKTFKEWDVQEAAKYPALMVLFYTGKEPPPEFLAQARSGFAVSPEYVPNFAKIAGYSAGAVVAGGAGIATGLIAGKSIAYVMQPCLKAAATLAKRCVEKFVEKVGTQVATKTITAASGTAAVGASVAIVLLMAEAGVIKGIQLVKYNEYMSNMDAAVAASKNPVSVEQLRNWLNTEEGVKSVYFWFTAQAATAGPPAAEIEITMNPIPPPPGVVGWWDGDGSGNDVKGGNNGSLQGGVSFAPGAVGQAFSFNGANGYVRVQASQGLPHGSSPRTFMMWVYTRPSSWVRDQNTVFHFGGQGTSPNFQARSTFGLDMDVYPNMQFYTWGSDVTFNAGTPPEGWAHVAITYDGNTVRIYTQGQQRAEKQMALNTALTTLDIGGFVGSPAFGGLYFDGRIDDFTVFNRALSESEIKAIYKADSLRL